MRLSLRRWSGKNQRAWIRAGFLTAAAGLAGLRFDLRALRRHAGVHQQLCSSQISPPPPHPAPSEVAGCSKLLDGSQGVAHVCSWVRSITTRQFLPRRRRHTSTPSTSTQLPYEASSKKKRGWVLSPKMLRD